MTFLRSRLASASTKPLTPKSESIAYQNPTTGRLCGHSFVDLPPELHLLISKELIYPDALSLKHTSRYFYSLIDTGVRLKVDWLVKRRMLHLDCPNDRRCNLRTDLEFCRGSVTSVTPPSGGRLTTCWVGRCSDTARGSLVPLTVITISLLMQRRREHIECESRPGLGCLVYDTATCAHRKDRWRRWMRREITIEIWWVLLAAIPLVLGWVWMTEFVRWVVASWSL